MTIEELPEDFIDFLKEVKEKDLKIVFELFRQQEFQKLRSTPNEDLTALKGRAMLVDEMEQQFLMFRNQPVNKTKPKAK